MNNVIGLRGNVQNLPGIIDERLVQHLERLLEKA
jgi:hypothetical protein